MKYKFAVMACTLILCSSMAMAAARSSNYLISTEVFDVGGTTARSNSYVLAGKLRDKQTGTLTNANHSLFEGFMRSVYSFFRPTPQPPALAAIQPKNGFNDQSISATITGANFRSGIITKLTKSGESDILASNIIVNSATRLSCQFNLTGKTIGYWDLTVTNDDGKTATLPQAFSIQSPSITVTKPVSNTPNPFNPQAGATTIKYSLSKDADIIIYLYNIRGERIWQYVASAGQTGGKLGENEVLWDGITTFKQIASSGVYIVTVNVQDGANVRTLSKSKIAIIK
ncbi:MAG: T9SS type A sorting domain-containing protein [Patescibacteria group bacterium]